jgi:hypothetical protein
MGRKPVNQKASRPHNPRRARRREQRRAFRKRFKVFFDGEPDSDMDYVENGLEHTIEAGYNPEEPED